MGYSEAVAMDIFLKIFLGSYGVMIVLELLAWKIPSLKWLSREWHRASSFLMIGLVIAMLMTAKVQFYPQYGNYSYNLFSLRFVGSLDPAFEAAPTPEKFRNGTEISQYQQAFLQEDFRKAMCKT